VAKLPSDRKFSIRSHPRARPHWWLRDYGAYVKVLMGVYLVPLTYMPIAINKVLTAHEFQ